MDPIVYGETNVDISSEQCILCQSYTPLQTIDNCTQESPVDTLIKNDLQNIKPKEPFMLQHMDIINIDNLCHIQYNTETQNFTNVYNIAAELDLAAIPYEKLTKYLHLLESTIAYIRSNNTTVYNAVFNIKSDIGMYKLLDSVIVDTNVYTQFDIFSADYVLLPLLKYILGNVESSVYFGLPGFENYKHVSAWNSSAVVLKVIQDQKYYTAPAIVNCIFALIVDDGIIDSGIIDLLLYTLQKTNMSVYYKNFALNLLLICSYINNVNTDNAVSVFTTPFIHSILLQKKLATATVLDYRELIPLYSVTNTIHASSSVLDFENIYTDNVHMNVVPLDKEYLADDSYTVLSLQDSTDVNFILPLFGQGFKYNIELTESLYVDGSYYADMSGDPCFFGRPYTSINSNFMWLPIYSGYTRKNYAIWKDLLKHPAVDPQDIFLACVNQFPENTHRHPGKNILLPGWLFDLISQPDYNVVPSKFAKIVKNRTTFSCPTFCGQFDSEIDQHISTFLMLAALIHTEKTLSSSTISKNAITYLTQRENVEVSEAFGLYALMRFLLVIVPCAQSKVLNNSMRMNCVTHAAKSILSDLEGILEWTMLTKIDNPFDADDEEGNEEFDQLQMLAHLFGIPMAESFKAQRLFTLTQRIFGDIITETQLHQICLILFTIIYRQLPFALSLVSKSIITYPVVDIHDILMSCVVFRNNLVTNRLLNDVSDQVMLSSNMTISSFLRQNYATSTVSTDVAIYDVVNKLEMSPHKLLNYSQALYDIVMLTYPRYIRYVSNHKYSNLKRLFQDNTALDKLILKVIQATKTLYDRKLSAETEYSDMVSAYATGSLESLISDSDDQYEEYFYYDNDYSLTSNQNTRMSTTITQFPTQITTQQDNTDNAAQQETQHIHIPLNQESNISSSGNSNINNIPPSDRKTVASILNRNNITDDYEIVSGSFETVKALSRKKFLNSLVLNDQSYPEFDTNTVTIEQYSNLIPGKKNSDSFPLTSVMIYFTIHSWTKEDDTNYVTAYDLQTADGLGIPNTADEKYFPSMKGSELLNSYAITQHLYRYYQKPVHSILECAALIIKKLKPPEDNMTYIDILNQMVNFENIRQKFKSEWYELNEDCLVRLAKILRMYGVSVPVLLIDAKGNCKVIVPHTDANVDIVNYAITYTYEYGWGTLVPVNQWSAATGFSTQTTDLDEEFFFGDFDVTRSLNNPSEHGSFKVSDNYKYIPKSESGVRLVNANNPSFKDVQKTTRELVFNSETRQGQSVLETYMRICGIYPLKTFNNIRECVQYAINRKYLVDINNTSKAINDIIINYNVIIKTVLIKTDSISVSKYKHFVSAPNSLTEFRFVHNLVDSKYAVYGPSTYATHPFPLVDSSDQDSRPIRVTTGQVHTFDLFYDATRNDDDSYTLQTNTVTTLNDSIKAYPNLNVTNLLKLSPVFSYIDQSTVVNKQELDLSSSTDTYTDVPIAIQQNVDNININVQIATTDYKLETNGLQGYLASKKFKLHQVRNDRDALFNAFRQAVVVDCESFQYNGSEVRVFTNLAIRASNKGFSSDTLIKAIYKQIQNPLQVTTCSNFGDFDLSTLDAWLMTLAATFNVVLKCIVSDGTSIYIKKAEVDNADLVKLTSVLVYDQGFWYVAVNSDIAVDQLPGFNEVAEAATSAVHYSKSTYYTLEDDYTSSKIIAAYLHIIKYKKISVNRDGNCGFNTLKYYVIENKEQQIERFFRYVDTLSAEAFELLYGTSEIRSKYSNRDLLTKKSLYKEAMSKPSYYLSITELECIAKVYDKTVVLISESWNLPLTMKENDIGVIYHENHFEPIEYVGNVVREESTTV